MACRYTYQGRTYEAAAFDDVLRAMTPDVASKYMTDVMAVPSAPFVGKTDAWVALAIKRIIKMAVDEGYDSVAFVNGEQSAERYKEALMKAVDTIFITKRGEGYDFYAKKDGSTVIEEKGVPASRVQEVFGKAGDDLVRKADAEPGRVAIKAESMSIGGEGMKAFYDKIVPSVAKDVLRKLGGDEMTTVTLQGSESKDALSAKVYGRGETYRNLPSEQKRKIDSMFDNREIKQRGFTITPAMREKAAGGLPLFVRPDPYTTKKEATLASFKIRGTIAVSDDNGGWLLANNPRPYNTKEISDAEESLKPLNEALKGMGKVPAVPLLDAPTEAMGLGRSIARIFGADVTFVKSHVTFEGVEYRGKIFVGPSLKHPELATIGHEVLHWYQRMFPKQYEALAKQIRGYLKAGAVDARRQLEDRLGGKNTTMERAESELLADLNGAMWLDPLFWREMAQNDPSLFRAVAYRFMEAVTKVMSGMTRFKADQMVTDVAAVRSIIAKEWAAQAQEQGESATEFSQEPAFMPTTPDTSTPQTETAEFKQFFGKSAVVDADGEALRVYHGSPDATFNVFAPEQYFAEAGDIASIYTGTSASSIASFAKRGDAPAVYPVYLKIERPFDTRIPAIRKIFEREFYNKYGTGTPLSEKGLPDWNDARDLAEWIKEEGKDFDGLIVDEGGLPQQDGSVKSRGISYIPLDGVHQVKSATGNTGAFGQRSITATEAANLGMTAAEANQAQEQGDIRFSRKDDGMRALSGVTETLKAITSPIGTVTLLDRTVSTKYHLSTKDADFKRVFDGFRQQTNDTAHYAIEAERNAPDVLMRLESLGDIWGGLVNSGKKQKDNLKAVSKALFANIEGQKGIKQVAYNDYELETKFSLTPKQISMYRQIRSAIDTSIERLAQTYAAQMGKDQGMDISRVKNFTLEDTVKIVKVHIQDAHDQARAAQAMREQAKQDDMDNAEADETAALARQYGKKVPDAPTEADTKALLDRLDKMAEHAEFLQFRAYTPAMRFGEFAVTVTDTKGEVLHFEMFESKTMAALAGVKLGKEYPGATVEKSVMNPEQYAMFKGVSPETVELFAKFTGNDQTEAYQNYIALAKSSRSVKMRELQRKGTAGFSEDPTRVLAAFITSNARQSAINMNSGEISDALASKSLARKGDVQREAKNLSDYMQNPQEEARHLRSFMFMYFLGGSVASAAVNLTQTFLVTGPYLSQFVGAKAASILVKSAKMVTTGNIQNAELKEAAKRAAEEGITEPNEIHQLMADASGSALGNSLRARAIIKAWGSMFALAESFNRKTTFLAAYQVAQETKQKNPYEFASKAVTETQFLYSKENRPNWARGAIGATIFTFKMFTISYIEMLARLPAKQKLIALGILILVAGVQGLPGADDLDDLIDTIGQSMGYNINSRKWKRKFLEDTFGKDLGAILHTGIFSPSAIDVSGRLSMGNIIPGTAIFKPSDPDKSRAVAELAGPISGVLAAFQKALGKAQQGEFGGAIQEMSPVAVKSLLKGIEMASTGVYKDTKGKKVTDVDAWDSFVKMLGLQPGHVAQKSRIYGDELQDKSMTSMMESTIADRWAQGIHEKDQTKVTRARLTLASWNRTNPESRIVITPVQIRKRVNDLRLPRTQRFLKTVPREQRRQVQEEFQ